MVERMIGKYEQKLKWLALFLGIISTICIIQNWYPAALFVNLPFCLIWVLCAWYHTERQLKYINILFSVLYIYGIARYLVIT